VRWRENTGWVSQRKGGERTERNKYGTERKKESVKE
jgi:hypothetical protein